jgi:hypothetical protein
MKIFQKCHLQKELILFCNNLLSLVQNTSDLSLALSTPFGEHPDNMKDELACQAASGSVHQESYGQMLQQLLTDTF